MPALGNKEDYYGRPLTLVEKLQLAILVVRMPFAITWACIKGALFRPKYLTFKRSVVHTMVRWANAHLPIPVMQYMTPYSLDGYLKWTKSMNVPSLVEDLVENTKLMWIGPKRADKVILCVHGGAYVSPLSDGALHFYAYLQKELAKSGREVGIAVLAYTLLPDAGFPTQMHQITIAVQHLLAMGLDPSNLHIIGDSAGGHIIINFLSHVLHPLPGIRKLSETPLSNPIGGAYLISPWVCMRSESASYKSNAPNDIMSSANVDHFADLVLAYASSAYSTTSSLPGSSTPASESTHTYTKEEQMLYLDPLNAPSGWFDGLDGVVSRILMTVGSEELFLDDNIAFSESVLAKTHADVRFVVQDGGVHDDPILDFMLDKNPKENLGSLMKVIMGWLEEGIQGPAYAANNVKK